MIILWLSHGLHALDVGVVLVGVSVAALLLRYAESLGEEDVPVRSRSGPGLRQRWASATLAYGGGMARLRSDQILLRVAVYFS